MFLALLALLLAPPDRPFSDERELLSRRLATLRRILPDAPDGVDDAALVKDLAAGSQLSSVEAMARPPLESPGRGDVAVDVKAVARFAEVERFFRQVALSPRLIDVESLALTATPEDTVRLVGVLHLPYRPAKTPLPPPPDGTRELTRGVPHPQAEAYRRDLALAVAKSEAIVSLRRARRNPRLFLSELAAIAQDRPVVLSYASLGDGGFVVRGLTVGQGPARALEGRFERGFLRLSDFLMRRQGACLQFEARGQSPVAGVDAQLPLPAEDPFEQDEAPCRVDRDPEGTTVLKPPHSKLPGKGPLSVRLRDMDLADVFQALHLATSQGFLVDSDVVGRVSLDLSGVTLEEALGFLEKKAGLKIAAAGAVRRVSLARGDGRKRPAEAPTSPAPEAPPGASPAVSFLLKRAEVRDILAVMTDADPSLAALGPQGFLGRESVWAKDVRLDEVRAALLEVAGLQERIEEGRRLLESARGTENALVPVAGEPPDRKLVLRAQDLTVEEFDLSGVASVGEGGWKAFAYSPTGALNVYAAGDRLADGKVASVDSTDVTLDTDDGPVRILLAPLSR